MTYGAQALGGAPQGIGIGAGAGIPQGEDPPQPPPNRPPPPRHACEYDNRPRKKIRANWKCNRWKISLSWSFIQLLILCSDDLVKINFIVTDTKLRIKDLKRSSFLTHHIFDAEFTSSRKFEAEAWKMPKKMAKSRRKHLTAENMETLKYLTKSGTGRSGDQWGD